MSAREPSDQARPGDTILMFASFMDLIDVTIVNVALPSIREDLGASPAQLQWIVSAYMLAFAVLLVTGGRLGDIFGRQRIFVIGVAGFTALSLAACLGRLPATCSSRPRRPRRVRRADGAAAAVEHAGPVRARRSAARLRHRRRGVGHGRRHRAGARRLA